MELLVYIDTILVPFSLFLIIGYHVFLCRSIKTNPFDTSIGTDAYRRKLWFSKLKEGDEKTGMLAVQSLRNTKMTTILTASCSILINLSLAALTNNLYISSHLLTSPIFGSQSVKLYILKFGSASTFLLISFLFSSLGLWFLTDANYLINACFGSENREYIHLVFERGFVLAFIGERLFCTSFPLLLWLFGPIPVVVSSLALVWVLYGVDFPLKLKR